MEVADWRVEIRDFARPYLVGSSRNMSASMVDSPTCLSTTDSVLRSMILFRLDQILEGLKWSTATRQGVLDSGMRKRRTESMATVGLQVMSAADTPMKTGESSMTYAQRRPRGRHQTVFRRFSARHQTVFKPSPAHHQRRRCGGQKE